MRSDLEVTGRAEARLAHRSSMYLAASLCSGGSSVPARIRNLSAAGALVEAAVVPSPSSQVRLIRGRLVVGGAIAWSDAGRCGVQFSDLVKVQEWLSSPANTEQLRVDETVRLIKAGTIPDPVTVAATREVGDVAAAQIADDLARTSALLEALDDALARDPEAVVRNAVPLQNLDIAAQTLAALAQAVMSGGSDPAIIAKLGHLRRSAIQAVNSSSAG